MMTDTDHARANAQAQLERIRQLVEWLDHVDSCQDDPCTFTNEAYAEYADPVTDEFEHADAQQAIQEHPLSVEVRSAWYTPGSSDTAPVEFQILLSTGGPACRIVGELNEHGEPESARIEYQDWGTPWTEYRIDNMGSNLQLDQDLLRYCQQFYFGE